ncbi:hypothetical protein AB0I61_17245 [Polymorphospora rubra]|uniref:hypothetical protein n=1 Tax=Polymorphospora rubra TaxID=338584 RepID=UPI0033E30A46
MDKTAALEALAACHRAEQDAARATIAAVAQAVNAGATWAEIGEQVAQAGPNAHRKYAKLLRVEPAE